MYRNHSIFPRNKMLLMSQTREKRCLHKICCNYFLLISYFRKKKSNDNWTKRSIREDPFNKTLIVWLIEPVNMHQSMEKNIWQITMQDTSKEKLLWELAQGILKDLLPFWDTTIKKTKLSENFMEHFNSASEDINSAFLFYNYSLYLQHLVKYEHSKNSSSIFVPHWF